MARRKKNEALNVTRLITEILTKQLNIPLYHIVNDKVFKKYTYMDRPDLLISNVPYDSLCDNEEEYIQNLVAYAEIKDNCKVDDKDWKDAYQQGMKKSKFLHMPYFIVSNCNVAYFYNVATGNEICLNGNPIREFLDLDMLNIILKRLQKNNTLENIDTGAIFESNVTQTVFNKKLWELANIYRQEDFKNINEKINFTIGMIALKYFEEKEQQGKRIRNNKEIYWSTIVGIDNEQLFVDSLTSYIKRLEENTEFTEFKDLMEVVRNKIAELPNNEVRDIFNIVESLKKLHGCGFDLFGSVYEMFASNKEKGDFGEYFTRRNYTHVFARILLSEEKSFNPERKFKILDPACGTGGFLTEAYKVLENNYKNTFTLNSDAVKFLQQECLFGIDVRQENVSKTKLNMFLVGDGHTHIEKENTLKIGDNQNGDVCARLGWEQFDYILTNPPYGNGNIRAESSSVSTIRLEIAFIAKIIKLLKVGGKACVIFPDGFFENPSFHKFRKEVLEKVIIEAVVSLPKFALAPYTKEKTYALFFKKKPEKNTQIQKESIWMYIIDNDGFANSDNRFATKLKYKDGSWKHDELSPWVNICDGEIMPSVLEERWKAFDDRNTMTEYVDESGEKKKVVKGGFISIKDVNDENYYNLLPEFHLRKLSPDYISIEEFDEEVKKICSKYREVLGDF